MTAPKTSKALKSSQKLSQLVKKYYKDIHEAKAQGKKIVWSSGIAPVELFHAMDLVPVFPENYAAACAVKQISQDLQYYAEKAGYISDLCSYFRSDIGHVLSNCTYLGGLPKPDLLVASRNLCTTHVKWFEVLSRYFNCPLFVWDLPFGTLNKKFAPEFHRLEYAISQLHELIKVIENITHCELNTWRLQEAIFLGDEAARLWIEINESRKNRPAPISCTDMLGNLFVLVTLSGTPIAVEFLREVAKEVNNRVSNKIGIVSQERFRLLWDVMPLWHHMELFDRFQSAGAVFVVELYNYGRVWGQRLDCAQPLESLAKRHLTHMFNIDMDSRVKLLREILREFQIDGYVNHVIRSCNVLNGSTLHLANKMKKELGIPTLTLESDHCDSRAFAPAMIENRIQAFLELLEANQ
ncbi:2-hydroxyacyl-CoA dehydratase subunit D [Desulfoscipio geothermicus]|uniref:Benzoyl-CoA reductase/2-hydroxyglutaryl-CoA dehydratase subunit, BcrC/BadD/HgdB n=1 Tax=Desulfoscipio geothermicus DSM 3669 TaxID=1121426 RepID=A0A1I6CQF4_9FIRM|nr:2-hydroxyacyl-CoA dehydratase family protein [Desulfoscipio geothermicus]SFQ95398.1 Benzoyl-CoA reductase/2-hydroxyglutaryl-CoA dehydratase subunit, BcrC/BadD/HgdB [Desulfoscipio geothermicus DSM 3669]